MHSRLIISFMLGLLFAGCSSVGHPPTEAMQVKQMRVNGVDLAYVEEEKARPSCSYTLPMAIGAIGKACGPWLPRNTTSSH
jgi:hypothetical protein